MEDAAHMRAALALAGRGLGNTWPNPAVGCVIVAADGAVVGRGWTQPGGRPHAETEALRRAGHAARGATAYVTLEPCCHWGRTPPCTDAMIAAGVARVVVAMRDPDPRVDGEGFSRLRAAGIAVEEGLLAADAAALNAGFLKRLRQGLPLVTLKLATTLDGRIATASKQSRWITGPEARRAAHGLRARHDAILVGSGTVLDDDPDLTCRLPGGVPIPAPRVVADARLRIPPSARLVRTARQVPTLVATLAGHPDSALAPLREAGVEVLEMPAGPEGLAMRGILLALAARGITRVLAEGGSGIAASLLREGLVDRLAWFHAPMVIGGDGVPAAYALDPSGPLSELAEAPKFRRVAHRTIGADILTEFEREAG
ncbi:bifunctional diaminohydroxyphosphoribosylaminopyrimidine deaminase/5-amino-6-(5-phosphoribosylamino)uracil reductase RibD [Falsiroseomonas selenitidurans]|uniref:Riboflavin biosynthesis protein RibD n=1 Tax=Falsiroseomonas selenitidurans TaxID=2716335 RepID=A0ABX1E0B4_9PROT|nr:bifunctional diaminohydroxyphosphoribosylaminopyrimidine deaminase/5-amino-6-(5-phosphoribosylamino)uracil reductase RibD [Falsiroseomonas selenitidurans]NKC29273.1 bifunctional diaminohydroxyphosphoribosylaminopyrimidine deaminase/5-amino-6-(5-phosphoribosylamino)uracil reductase RibD [Falsiroseomonas selenitidurans]